MGTIGRSLVVCAGAEENLVAAHCDRIGAVGGVPDSRTGYRCRTLHLHSVLVVFSGSGSPTHGTNPTDPLVFRDAQDCGQTIRVDSVAA